MTRNIVGVIVIAGIAALVLAAATSSGAPDRAAGEKTPVDEMIAHVTKLAAAGGRAPPPAEVRTGLAELYRALHEPSARPEGPLAFQELYKCFMAAKTLEAALACLP